MTRLQQGEQQANARRRRHLERKLFGVRDSSDTASLSLRDAHQRASLAKTPRQALTLLSTAERSGDSVLARAVAAHAWDPGWTGVLDTYASERSGVLNDFQQLDELERPRPTPTPHLEPGLPAHPTPGAAKANRDDPARTSGGMTIRICSISPKAGGCPRRGRTNMTYEESAR